MKRTSRTDLHAKLPAMAQFAPEELRLWSLLAAGYRDEAIAEKFGLPRANVSNQVSRLVVKIGANRHADSLNPRTVAALMYWRATGRLRDDQEMCVCPHVHTGPEGRREVPAAVAPAGTNGLVVTTPQVRQPAQRRSVSSNGVVAPPLWKRVAALLEENGGEMRMADIGTQLGVTEVHARIDSQVLRAHGDLFYKPRRGVIRLGTPAQGGPP